MTIKYTVTRMGDKSDRGPSGEFGFMVPAESGGKSTGLTLRCPTAHTHSRDCAQTLLDVQPVVTPTKAAVLDVDGITVLEPAVAEVLGKSPRTVAQEWHQAIADKDAEAVPEFTPLPKKNVQKVVDGKLKTVSEDDGGLS